MKTTKFIIGAIFGALSALAYHPARADGFFTSPIISCPSSANVIAGRVTHGDSVYAINATDVYVATSAALSVPRTWTLPAASAVFGGCPITVADDFGGVTSTNTLTVQRAGSDTIDGATSSAIATAYGVRQFVSDGVSKWKIVNVLTTLGSMASQDASAVAITGGTVSGADTSSAVNTATGGTASQTQAARASQQLSVKDFANVKCDGSTDDTTALAGAVSGAGAGNTLIIPPNVTCVGKIALNVASITLVVSAGSTLKMPAAGTGAVITSTAANVSVIGAGAVDGNRTNAGTNADCISVVGVAGNVVNGLTIAHCKRYGVHATDSATFTLKNAAISDTGNIAAFAEITGSVDIPGMVLQNISVDRSAEGTIVEGGLKAHGTASHVFTGAVISGNTLLMPTSPAASAAIGEEIWDCTNCTISNSTATGGYMGFSFANVKQSSIINHTSYNASHYGLELAGVNGVDVGQTSVNGGSLALNGVIIDPFAGRSINSSHVTLTGTHVESVTAEAIKAQDATWVSVGESDVTQSAADIGVYMLRVTHFAIGGGTLNGTSTGTRAVGLTNSWDGTVRGVHASDWTGDCVALVGTTTETIDSISVSGNDCLNTTGLVSHLSGGAALGTNIKSFGNTHLTDYTDFLNSTALTKTTDNLSVFASTTSAQLAGVLSDESGTGVFCLTISCVMTTPNIGVATATSINGNIFTTGTYTLTGTAGKTLTFSNSLTLAGTDGQTMTFPTTSATIARTDTAQTFTGAQTFTSDPIIGSDAGGARKILIDSAAGNARSVFFQTASSNRWQIGASSAAESGSNAGSAFQIVALDDSGATIDTPFAITRVAGGAMTISRPVTMADAQNFLFNTSTGTKFGTGTAQKLSFWNATPVAQISGSTDVLAGLVTVGLRAASSNPPLNLGTGAITSGAITAGGAVDATSFSISSTTQKFPKTFTVTYDPVSLAAANVRADTVTVTGITTTGGAVTWNAGSGSDPFPIGCIVQNVYASATNTVKINWMNSNTVTACDVLTSTWTFTQAQ